MTWLATKVFFEKAWAWCKHNWKFIAGISVALIVSILMRKPVNYRKILERTKEDHKKELEAIETRRAAELKALEDEKNARAEAERALALTLERIKTQAHEKNIELSEKKEKEIKRVLKEENATEKLSGILGFDFED